MPELRISTILKRIAALVTSYSNIKAWDIYGKERQAISISAERGAIKTAEFEKGKGYGVRVFGPSGNIGFAHSNILTPQAMERTVTTAVKMLSATTPDSEFLDLPENRPQTQKGPDFFDKQTSMCSIEDVFEILNSMLARHSNNPQLYTTGGRISTSYGAIAIVNSHGIDVTEKLSDADVYFETVIKEQEEQVSGSWFDSATSLHQLDPLKVSDTAVERAKAELNRKTMPSGEYPVILSPQAVKSVILRPISAAISAENVYYGRTFLGNSVGKRIASDLLTITDDPFDRRLLGSRFYDDEGVPTRKIDLVKHGTLRTLLHNSYTAFKAGTDLTGHATRASVGSIPDIHPNNLLIPAGTASLEDMLSGIPSGVYFDVTGDSPNLATGEFSGLIMQGFAIKEGKRGPALANTMIGINLRDLFERIDMIGKELTNLGSSRVPHIRITHAKITSGA